MEVFKLVIIEKNYHLILIHIQSLIIAVGSFDYFMVAEPSPCLMIFMQALVSQPSGQESLIKVQHGKALNKVGRLLWKKVLIGKIYL